MKTLDFLGSFVACDLKVGTYIQLIEFMKSFQGPLKSSQEIQGQGHLLTLAKGHLHIKFET